VDFEVIPAVDVSAGRLARLVGGRPEPVEAFHGDPLAAAAAFVEAGARWVHVVDVDLALTGRSPDVAVVQAVAGLGVRVQASGGFRTAAQVEAALEAGAGRVVLGSAALADRELAGELIGLLGARLLVGIEAEGASVVSRGQSAVELPLDETLEWLAQLPIERFLHTQIGRVGGLEGPDVVGVRRLVRVTGRPVIAAGGIRGVSDLRNLASLGRGVEGAVVGRALYEGLDLRVALEAVAGRTHG
jgi:phosphoribosylformimino-5-aminoimidazole carboxamide ribonucleotide (ProFAR) isomerase